MNLIDIIILILLVVSGFFALAHIRKNKGKCCGSCTGCNVECAKKH